MANRYIGGNLGDTDEDIVEGSSTNSTDVEVRVDLSKGLEKIDAKMILEAIIRRIDTFDTWPLA